MSAMNGVSFASLNGELIDLMKRAGFKAINISLVSTSDSLRNTMGRTHGVSDFNTVLDVADKAGLNVVAYAILGMPGQTIEDMVDTVGYLMSRKVLIGPSIYYPVPGTALFGTCRKEGVLPRCTSQYRSSAVPVETGAFSRLDLITLIRLVRAVNFIKGKIDEKVLPEGIHLHDLVLLLREKRGIKNAPVTPSAFNMQGPMCRTEEGHSWQELLFRLLAEKALFCLQKTSDGSIIAAREVQSKKLTDHFLERLWLAPIRGSRVQTSCRGGWLCSVVAASINSGKTK
jgi:hypothetical protein